MNNELYHHGILGMKWGVRRYQNSDGTLTAAGKKRYGTEYEHARQVARDKRDKSYEKAMNDSGASRVRKLNRAADEYDYDLNKVSKDIESKIRKDVGDEMEAKANIAKESSKMANELGTTNSAIAKLRRRKEMNQLDTSELTDEEMRTKINRLNLEKQYKLAMTEDMTAGEMYVDSALAIAGGVLATTASVLTIAVQVQKLMGK